LYKLVIITDTASWELGVPKASKALKAPRRSPQGAPQGAYLCRELTGAKLKSIGSHFGISDAAVSQVFKRLDNILEVDRRLRIQVTNIKKRIRKTSEGVQIKSVGENHRGSKSSGQYHLKM
jgi:hypothetical protein